MKMKRSSLPFALVAFLLVSCASLQHPYAIRAHIELNNISIENWYGSGDADGVASMFAVDAWQMPPNSPPLVGREAIRAFWKQALRWGKWGFSLKTQDVQTFGPLAVERGKYVLRFTAGSAAPPGMSSFTDHGNYVVYWRRGANGQWLAVWDAPVSEVSAKPAS